MRPLGPALELWKGFKVITLVVTGRAVSHPFSTTAALGWFLGIPAPSSFASILGEIEIRQKLKEVTLLNVQQWTFSCEEKI